MSEKRHEGDSTVQIDFTHEMIDFIIEHGVHSFIEDAPMIKIHEDILQLWCAWCPAFLDIEVVYRRQEN